MELESRIPEAAPYVTAEAQFFPPPYRGYWKGIAHPGQCQSCHKRIFDEWTGSMMANAWRDPTWRGAFLLSARQTSTRGDCDVPRSAGRHRQGALQPVRASRRMRLAIRCRRCARHDCAAGIADGRLLRALPHAEQLHGQRAAAERVDRTAVRPGVRRICIRTSIPLATQAPAWRSRRSTRSCATPSPARAASSAPSATASPRPAIRRITPSRSADAPKQPEYVPRSARATRDCTAVPDAAAPNLGYGIGAGSFRLSPHAIGFPERFGPLVATPARRQGRVSRGRVQAATCRTSRWTPASTRAITTC